MQNGKHTAKIIKRSSTYFTFFMSLMPNPSRGPHTSANPQGGWSYITKEGRGKARMYLSNVKHNCFFTFMLLCLQRKSHYDKERKRKTHNCISPCVTSATNERNLRVYL